MNVIDPTKLAEILASHLKWLRDEVDGDAPADLRFADLSSADLSFANLRFANLSFANLRFANLSFANLSFANLSSADLRFANLSSADLRFANLSSADLRFANLSFANGIEDKYLRKQQIVPEIGPFTAFKKLRENIVAQLEITGDRVGGVCGRKCRASKATVVAFFNADETPAIDLTEARSLHSNKFVYRLGEIIKPDSYNPSMVEECSNGIHFFLSFAEAAEFSL